MERVTAEAAKFDRLDDVAFVLRTMQFGSFVEFAEAIDCKPGKLWDWAVSRRAPPL
ncbi:MAG TPA: hypothetical protein VHT52_17980 [Stellaceae bacterium]|nr:hypothetical protein [Stellaceae bacterium]